MQCVNGHPADPGQQFCNQCGQPVIASSDTGSVPPPPPSGFPPVASPPPSSPPPAAPTSVGSSPPPPPEGGFGQGSATPQGPPPGQQARAQVAQVEAQAAKWAPVKRELLAGALVVSVALLLLSSFLAAITFETRGFDGAWKYRLQTLAGSGLQIGVMLVLAAFLTSTAAETIKGADLARKVSLGVLVTGAATVLFLLMGLIGDLGFLGDSFATAVSSGGGHVAALLLVAAAGAVALMTRPSKI